MRTRRQAVQGFSLPEVIVTLMISTIVIGALLMGVVAVVRSLQPPVTRLGGETLPIAPSFGAFPSAVRLHRAFSQRTTEARAVYVFGGTHPSLSPTARAATMKPLRLRSLPAHTDFSAGLPLDAAAFHDRYSDTFGPQESAAAPDDFTVVTIGPVDGALGVTCVVQARTRTETISDGATSASYTIRDVNLWEVGGGALRYVFAERPQQAAGVFVGAVHAWTRFNPTDNDGEEALACVVFPDPWIYGGSRGRPDDMPPFSRFNYVLAVSR